MQGRLRLEIIDVSVTLVCCHAVTRKKPGLEIIDVSVTAMMDNLTVAVCTNDKLLTDIKIAGKDWLEGFYSVTLTLFKYFEFF